MTGKMQVRVSSKKMNGQDSFEGTVSIAGLKPTRLARKSDGETRFSSRSALTSTARSVAKSLGFSDIDFGATTTSVKKAAKKTVKKTVKKTASSAPSASANT